MLSVIFDLDGTLIESEQIWRDVRRAVVVAHGGRWVDGVQEKMIGMRTTEWAHYMHDDLGVALAPQAIAEQVVNAVAQTALEATGWNKYFEVVVEDSSNGIRSAYAAQLAVIAIPNHAFPPDPQALALAKRVLTNIGELDVSVVDKALEEQV